MFSLVKPHPRAMQRASPALSALTRVRLVTRLEMVRGLNSRLEECHVDGSQVLPIKTSAAERCRRERERAIKTA